MTDHLCDSELRLVRRREQNVHMAPNPSQRPAPERVTPPPEPEPVVGQEIDDHTGATDAQVGDLTGPGAGYDQEPKQEKDKGGVS